MSSDSSITIHMTVLCGLPRRLPLVKC